MILPRAADRYDRTDQDRLRAELERAVSLLEQLPGGWEQPTGTSTRTTFDTATVTLPELAEAVKALIDDLALRIKS